MRLSKENPLSSSVFRRHMGILAVSLLSVLSPVASAQAESSPPTPLPPTTTFETERVELEPGTLTVYITDSLMEAQVMYRTGTIGGWVFEKNSFQKAILAATDIDELLNVPGLIDDRAMFLQAKEYNPHLLEAMQAAITEQCLMAVDAQQFGIKGERMASGMTVLVVVSEVIDATGKIVQLRVPKVSKCQVWDVLATKDRYQTVFLADVAPKTYAKLVGAYWDSERGYFNDKQGNPIDQLPKVKIILPQSSF